MSCVTPLGVPHYTIKKTQLGGFLVPKVFHLWANDEYDLFRR